MTYAPTAYTAAARESARFWDRIADRYSRKPVPDEAVYQRKLAITRDYLSPDMDVLEIGCGTGSTAIAHAPHVRHVRGVDVSPRMVEIATAKARAAGVANVSFEAASLEQISADKNDRDAVLALSLLHLIDDWQGAVAKIASMLKPGGLFVSNTGCLADRMAWFKLVVPIGRLVGLMPLIRVFSQRDLERCLVANGFDIEYRWRPDDGTAVFIVARKRAA